MDRQYPLSFLNRAGVIQRSVKAKDERPGDIECNEISIFGLNRAGGIE